MRRILVASDFSEASRPALATAVRMAKRDRATLTILHVTEPSMPVSADQSTAYAGWDQHEKQLRAWATASTCQDDRDRHESRGTRREHPRGR